MKKENKGKLNKYSFCLSLIFALIITYISAGNTIAATFDIPGDFATIQDAIDDAGVVNGDTINVLAGTHVEDFIDITKELTIQGQGIGSTIIDPSSLGGFTVVFYPKANNVIIRNMTIQNADQAIRFELAGQTIDGTTIQLVSMLDNSSRGIEVHNATTVTNLLVDQCNFENTHHGLRIASSGHLNNVSFIDSTFIDNAIGIYIANDGSVSTLDGIDVTGCTFNNHTTAALFLEEVQNALIETNNFNNNRRDIQIFKWYQASVPVSDVTIRENIMLGTTDAVFALFNADNITGQTVFSDITITKNRADTSDASAVYAGAHSTYQSASPSLGGIGWNTVDISKNCFTGITTAGNGVRYFIPAGIMPDQALGGATLDVRQNYWGTTDIPTITAWMQNPSITDFTPIRQNDNQCPSVGGGANGGGIGQGNNNNNGNGKGPKK